MSDEQNIIRMWRGVIRTQDREEYVGYVERTGIEQRRWELFEIGGVARNDREAILNGSRRNHGVSPKMTLATMHQDGPSPKGFAVGDDDVHP